MLFRFTTGTNQLECDFIPTSEFRRNAPWLLIVEDSWCLPLLPLSQPPFWDVSKSHKVAPEVPRLTQRCSSRTAVNVARFFSLQRVRVTKKRLPSSPTLLLLAQNRMIKGGVSHQRNRQQCYCTFKGGRCHIVRWQQRDVDLQALSPSPGEIRGGPGGCVLLCCSEWSDQRGGGGVTADRLTWMCQCVSSVYLFSSVLNFYLFSDGVSDFF